MDTFFDLREFLITILKKLKLCLVITLTFTLLGGAIRFVPLMMEYLNFEEPTVQSNEDSVLAFPYKYQSRRTIYIPPEYHAVDGGIVDISEAISTSYLACYQNKEILQPLIDKYYTDAAKDFVQYNQKLVNYNYNTKTILEKPFTLPDFYGIINIRAVEGGNYISIYATTGNKDLSEMMVEDTENLLSSYVKNLVGEFSYTVTEGQIGMLTPQAANGLIPKTLSSGTNNVATRIELNYIIKRSVKGCVWGLAGGIGLSVILCFLFNCLSLNLVSETDLKGYSVPTLFSIKVRGKKRFLGFIDSWIDILEGNNQNCHSYAEAAQMASTYIHFFNHEKNNTIVVTGGGRNESLEEFVKELVICEDDYSIISVDSICTSPQAVYEVSKSSGVLLFEELGYSNRQEIKKEIERIEQLGKPVYGIILKK